MGCPIVAALLGCRPRGVTNHGSHCRAHCCENSFIQDGGFSHCGYIKKTLLYNNKKIIKK